MKKNTTGEVTFVALDAHKRSHQAAMLLPGSDNPLTWEVMNNTKAIRKMVTRVKRESGDAALFCYEAGPCGFSLKRTIESMGVRCMVVAPSLIPVKPGERVKTDRRDACKLAFLLRAGMLTEVEMPTVEEEAVRDLCRCREALKQDLLRARHRMSKFLLRRGIIYNQGAAWTQRHRAWLRSIEFEFKVDRLTFDDYLRAIEQMEERQKGLDENIAEVAQSPAYKEKVGLLRCFRGIETVTAMTILSELHGFRRFESPRQLMSYLGLTPSEYSSGDRIRHGPITKAGNSHVRRVLVEAAWHSRHKPCVGVALRKRRKGQPAWAIDVADKAKSRLHRRFWKLINKGKPYNKAVTAVARELVGFIWDVLYREEVGRPQLAA